jgi:uncharacterized protein GlcG (DUF336 family)
MTRLTLTQANHIIETALLTARQRRLRAMAIVVLDDAGQVRAVQREDGASAFRIDIASGKAWAAISMGASSRTLGERARENPAFYGAMPAMSHGKFLAHTGAVLIKHAGEIIGAVGASGGSSDEDEAICMAGVEAAGLQHA